MTVSLRFKSFFALFMAAVLLLLPNSSAFAADYPPPQIKIKFQGQENSQWCWNAVSVMLLELYGKKMTQEEYAMYVLGHTKNVTILEGEFKGALNDKGIYGDYKDAEKYGPATWDEIKSSINKGYPVVVFRYKQNGNGHIIIINGYYTKPGDSNQYLIITDPKIGEDWYTYDEIAKDKYWDWDGTWLNVRNKK